MTNNYKSLPEIINQIHKITLLDNEEIISIIYLQQDINPNISIIKIKNKIIAAYNISCIYNISIRYVLYNADYKDILKKEVRRLYREGL